MLASLEADPGHNDPDVAAQALALVPRSDWHDAVEQAAHSPTTISSTSWAGRFRSSRHPISRSPDNSRTF